MKKIRPAFANADYEAADVTAIQALERGDASPDLQKRALDWVINNVCRTYDQSYRPDPYETAFHEGRRFCGNEVIKMLKLDARKVADQQRRERNES